MIGMAPERCLELIQGFPSVSALVVGDVMLDVYLNCAALGVANEAPVPLLEILQQTEVLGGAANVAANLARMGVRTQLVAMIGGDAEGQRLAGLLSELGVAFHPLITARPTARKTRILSEGHYYLRIDDEDTSALTDSEADALCRIAAEASGNTTLLVVSDYSKGLINAASACGLEAMAKRVDLKVVADLKPQSVGYWNRLDLITPNLNEARALRSLLNQSSAENLEESELAKELSQELGCDVVLKLAGSGMVAVTRHGEVSRFKALCQLPRNSSGAGDTVLSALAAALGAGATLEEAASLASAAASIAVSDGATHAVSASEMLQVLASLT